MVYQLFASKLQKIGIPYVGCSSVYETNYFDLFDDLFDVFDETLIIYHACNIPQLPTKLPENVKSAVIQQWLQGSARDLIAVDTGLSAGAVTNIINQWRRGLSYPLADDLRELAVTFKKIGITATQCALGFRLATIMIKCGVNELEFEYFISDIYNNCKKLDIPPDKIAYYMDELLKFSKDMSLSQISDYIKQKTNEKSKLEKDIEDLQEKIKQLKEEKLAAEELYNASLENGSRTAAILAWYVKLKTELDRYKIPLEDVSLFAKAVSRLGQYGYDTDKIMADFSELDFLKRQLQFYRNIIPDLENKYEKLNEECTSLEQTVNSHRQRSSVYDELEQMGFGLKELKLLWHTITEIAEANNISSEDAVHKFFKDVEEQYDDKLGFESKLDRLRSDAVYFNQEIDSLRSTLRTQPLVGPALQRLFENGIKEQDIIELAIIFGMYSSSHSGSGRGGGGNNPINKQTLISELNKYGSVKAMMQALDQRNDELKNEVASLEAKKTELNNRNHRILSILAFSKQIMYYFKGMVDSLRDEILMRYVTLAYVNYMLNLQFQLIPKFDDALSGEFAPILRAAKLESDRRYRYEKNNNDRDEDDDEDDAIVSSSSSSSSINELKVAVARAISLMINNLKYRSNSDDIGLIEILDNARIALEKEHGGH
jgi:predicted  nucleic acid-binding Zn-ribbon protein